VIARSREEVVMRAQSFALVALPFVIACEASSTTETKPAPAASAKDDVAEAPPPATEQASSAIVDQTVVGLDGKEVKLSSFRGKAMLIVNTASECGYTPQYAPLEKLWREYKDKGLVVVGFPSNDFGAQEPGTPEEIAKFTSTQFDVTFR
jgi:glutathione peroxidase